MKTSKNLIIVGGVAAVVVVIIVVYLLIGSYSPAGTNYTAPEESSSQNVASSPTPIPPPESAPTPSPEPPPVTLPPPAHSSETFNVAISNFAYAPSEIHIKVGDKIIWTNEDSVGHTVTSDSGSELDSALFGKNETYEHVFNTSGNFTYHCTPHKFMTGKVIVE